MAVEPRGHGRRSANRHRPRQPTPMGRGATDLVVDLEPRRIPPALPSRAGAARAVRASGRNRVRAYSQTAYRDTRRHADVQPRRRASVEPDDRRAEADAEPWLVRVVLAAGRPPHTRPFGALGGNPGREPDRDRPKPDHSVVSGL